MSPDLADHRGGAPCVAPSPSHPATDQRHALASFDGIGFTSATSYSARHLSYYPHPRSASGYQGVQRIGTCGRGLSFVPSSSSYRLAQPASHVWLFMLV